MTDMNTTVERIKSANPVPSHDSLPSGAASTIALLARIDERSKTMTDTLTPIREIDPPKPPRRGRGPLIALVVAAVVILVIGVTTFTILTGDEQPVVTEPPAPTTTVTPTTTQAPATTTTPAPQGLLPVDTPPLEVAAALSVKWDVGAVDRGWAFFHPDTESYLAELRPGVDEELWYRWATRMKTEHECEVRTPAELEGRTPRVSGAEIVTCVDTITSGLEPGVEVAGGTWAIEVADGWVYDFFILDFVGALSETSGLNEYRSWMQETIPDRYSDLFDEATLAITVDTPEAREGHRELVPFFIADTGPRPERALPEATPLMDVVTEFSTRWDAGDVEGYEALINPAIGYPPGNDAWAAYFGAVTGVTTERTCTELDAITVRCQEIGSSDFGGGEGGFETTVDYVGRHGWILAINFPDGESALVQPATAPGVAEYRRWVKDNDPEAFAELFTGGIVMRLDTPEVRAQHQEMVARYLAATS